MRSTLAALLVAGAAASAQAGGLAVVGTELRDNGDHDGYADTNETVELWLTVRNTTPQALTAVVATLSTSGTTACIIDGTAAVGDLAPGASVRAAEPLVFHVGVGQDRTALGTSPFDILTASFGLSFTASPAAPAAVPSRLVFDLDLDVAGTGPSTTVTEGFESGFGLFQVQNLDFGRHVNPEFGAAADGYRCQYHEPYCDHASCDFDVCYIGGTAAAADAIWWNIDGRAYTGVKSLYFGKALTPGPGNTTPTAAASRSEECPCANAAPARSAKCAARCRIACSFGREVSSTATMHCTQASNARAPIALGSSAGKVLRRFGSREAPLPRCWRTRGSNRASSPGSHRTISGTTVSASAIREASCSGARAAATLASRTRRGSEVASSR